MGRTNPTFRDTLEAVRGDWDRYRRGLRRDQTDAFDALFADAEAHADASGYLNAREPLVPILVSMLLEQQLTVRDLEERVVALEERIERRDACSDGTERAGEPTAGPD
jgi:hypothetical protein